ncbi:bifunctional diaminohydroxyphosphoribosylaminopyrimidine deaminase/5-amino-6-(5-phosphoribosylamino)uracil reductase RibD [Corynebacterium testudinoris]|uniref:Riboflavin biosynthesis protein RibD n=1 Tax=Corynebacterium testudinoris TaxID=136857 RepID=A0A0G3HCH1_9CORY|nr:bifunctional diaminohydroxyphosphoribosylaminopyrimidine deaminase/5-amino-6-(5-phosphoribosylamino)uracil reductase RibD [Corynebacterium testudinoris]AKK08867.1 diaminohydroxyphosphoribosylaminopyrimidinedeaminase/5-amino-6-(5-phosphoribosylamino)uracilreductase [Corynebacterium testudinoris]MBX8994922.1 bifunctional diaminohydroxyphosphoribosylaminopyrimidine deaminase/5-amino-6-(5-phosphoribosylamino)uracil reductase RibD [Corynebacterium testudinoris]
MPPLPVEVALRAALQAGAAVHGTTSPNPPVGAAILSADGQLVGVGGTQPAGGPHAEVMALRAAGDQARGGMAVVTLEPCNHTGRTGPCSQALVEAGVAYVRYLHSDPNAAASGGADYLRAHGVDVQQLPDEAPDLAPWLAAVRMSRPHVTLKFAQTLDGFTAAEDGSSQWITGEEARRHVHADRRRRDAIIIGTGTAVADNPSLTARLDDGLTHQPRRVIIGTRDLQRPGFEQYPGITQALAALWETGARDILVEGGASLASSFLEAGVVDAVQAYLAPTLLGDGRGVLARAVGPTLADAIAFDLDNVIRLGDDVLLEMTRRD